MADPHWTSYVGMVTGISGAIMGFISYRRSNSLKSLDLRLELRKAVNQLHQKTKQTNELIIEANKSRRAVASAMGQFRSGRMELWDKDVEADQQLLTNLNAETPDESEAFSGLTAEALEAKLVEVHRIHGEITSVSEKYAAAIEEDNEMRRHIRNSKGRA